MLSLHYKIHSLKPNNTHNFSLLQQRYVHKVWSVARDFSIAFDFCCSWLNAQINSNSLSLWSCILKVEWELDSPTCKFGWLKFVGWYKIWKIWNIKKHIAKERLLVRCIMYSNLLGILELVVATNPIPWIRTDVNGRGQLTLQTSVNTYKI